MTKKEQIIEMAKAMEDFELQNTYECDIELAGHLYNKGYRKIPEDSVVLSKEEYEMLVNQYKNLEIKYSNLSDNYRLCKDANETLKQSVITARKETATNFFKDLIRQADFWGETDMWVSYKTLVTVAKQYGVEVEE